MNRRLSWGRAVAAAVAAGLAVAASTLDAVSAPPVEITTKDGRQLFGTLEEKAGKLTLTPLSGEEAVHLTRADIKTQKYFILDAARTEFTKQKGALKAEDDNARLVLADWAAKRGLLPEAEALYDELGKKGNRLAGIQAARLKQIREGSAATATKTDTGTGTPSAGPVGKLAAAVAVDERAVKLIRIREYAAGDRVRIELAPEHKDALSRDEAWRVFVGFNIPGERQLEAARAIVHKTPADADKLVTKVEPGVLREWHVKPLGGRSIQDILIRGCATTQCHAAGSGKAGFQLLVPGSPAAALKEGESYGNFDFVRRYADGTMLRPGLPDASPLMHYFLTKAEKDKAIGLDPAIRTHPEVKGYGSESGAYKAVVGWIAKLRPYEDAFPPKEEPKTPAPAPGGGAATPPAPAGGTN